MEEAAKTAKIGVDDLNELAEFAEPGDIEQLREFAEQIEEYIRQMAERQGLEKTAHGYQLAPKAYRLFQGRLLEHIFSNLEAARTGRHQGPILGEGAVEMQNRSRTSLATRCRTWTSPDVRQRMVRNGPGLPMRMGQDDIEIHRTRNTPKCASVVLLDMSGSMRYDGLYIDVKRMGLALEGLIRREYPGDYLQFVELFSFAKPRHVSEIAGLMPKPVTIYDPVVQLRADMSDENDQRVRHSAALHEHPARAAIGPPFPRRAGHAEPPHHSHHRRPADGPLRGPVSLSPLPAATGGPKR